MFLKIEILRSWKVENYEQSENVEQWRIFIKSLINNAVVIKGK